MDVGLVYNLKRFNESLVVSHTLIRVLQMEGHSGGQENLKNLIDQHIPTKNGNYCCMHVYSVEKFKPVQLAQQKCQIISIFQPQKISSWK